MNSKVRTAAAALVAVGVATMGGSTLSCSSEDDATTTTTTGSSASPSSTTVDDDAADGGTVIDSPGPVDLAVGGRATLVLDANPTTGYQWEPSAAPDDTVVRIVEDTYVAGSSGAMGAGGSQRIVVEGVAAGTTTLELRYVRPWEPDADPAETVSFPVTVS